MKTLPWYVLLEWGSSGILYYIHLGDDKEALHWNVYEYQLQKDLQPYDLL